METITLTIDELAQLENLGVISTDFDFESEQQKNAVGVTFSVEGMATVNYENGTSEFGTNWSMKCDDLDEFRFDNFKALQVWVERVRELNYALAQGDVVFQIRTENCYLRYEHKGESQELYVGDGGTAADWQPTENDTVEYGTYQLEIDGYWSEEDCYWQKNTETNSPYVASDFHWDYNGWVYNNIR